MSTRLRHPRGLPLVGLLVMAMAGVWAGPYTPPWFDPDDACLRGTPCPGDAESVQALRALSWVTWTGAVLLVAGVALAAWALTRSATTNSPSRPADARRTAAHACAAGVVTTAVVAVAGIAGLAATLGVSEQLGLTTLAGSWVLLGRALEALQRPLGRPAGAGPAYLSSLVVAGLAPLATVAAVVGGGTDDYWWAVMTAGLAAAAATALSDVVPWRRWRAARVGAVLVVGGTAVGGLGAALGALGLLQPVEQPRAAIPPPVEVGPRPPAPPPSPTSPDPTTTAPDPGVPARKPCAAAEVRLDLEGFDAAMGARVVTLHASNSGTDACYLDGFAAVSLRQAGQRLDVVSGTTSSEQPGSDGRATRVGLGPGDAASATLYWRGYGAAADTTTPQTLEVTLRPGTQPLSVAVGPQFFDLVDGGELRVGNWVAGG